MPINETHNPLSLSVVPAVRLLDQSYYNLSAVLELMQTLHTMQALDGFEFQNLAEWDARFPPLDEAERRLAAWQTAPKYTPADIASQLGSLNLPIISIHANRDVGICLCSTDSRTFKQGEQLVHESLAFAQALDAEVCVFHLWDTWKEDFDLPRLEKTFNKIAREYKDVKACVENIPTHLSGKTPFDLLLRFEWITLDTRWAALYAELDKFAEIRTSIANVHLQGRLQGTKWLEGKDPHQFDNTLKLILSWDYTGPLTLEPHGLQPGWLEKLIASMAQLKTALE